LTVTLGDFPSPLAASATRMKAIDPDSGHLIIRPFEYISTSQNTSPHTVTKATITTTHSIIPISITNPPSQGALDVMSLRL
jgi:hypothetical protein